MGGRGAGRSTVGSQFANSNLVSDEYFRCAIMRYILGDVRNSIYREIVDRAEESGITSSLTINDSLMSVKYGQNSINAVGFKKSSSDQRSKLKSLANYNCVIIEEADEVPEEDFMQLDDSLRTKRGSIKIVLLLNPPPKTHWIIERWFNLEQAVDEHGNKVSDFFVPKLKPELSDDTCFIHTNYKDNIKNLDSITVTNYLRYRETKPQHYFNMVEGFVPETVRGRIYSGWRQVDSVPHEAFLLGYGLDFGYSNDPTAIVAVYRFNGGLIFDEIAYQIGLRNTHIAQILKSVETGIVIADSAEPKSIDELKLHGLTVLPSEKGKDSVRKGIDNLQDQKISVTKRSVNIWKEYNNYSWHEDKDGNLLSEPKPGYDHAMDAVRYLVNTQKPPTAFVQDNNVGGIDDDHYSVGL